MSRELFHKIEFKPASQDILHTKFLTEEICSILLQAVKQKDTWNRNNRLPYYTDDIHLDKDLPEWHEVLTTGVEEALKVASGYWGIGVGEAEVASMFAIRYTLDTQIKLDFHHDDSYISGSIKLNNNYSGGELYFPRQNFANKSISIGDLILWPGQLTHPHGSLALTEGEKYSITIWTKNESLANHR